MWSSTKQWWVIPECVSWIREYVCQQSSERSTVEIGPLESEPLITYWMETVDVCSSSMECFHMLGVSAILCMLCYDFEILGIQVDKEGMSKVSLMWSLCRVIQTLPCEQRNGEISIWLVRTWGSRRILAEMKAPGELTETAWYGSGAYQCIWVFR